MFISNFSCFLFIILSTTTTFVELMNENNINVLTSVNVDDIDQIIEQNKKCIEELKKFSTIIEKRFTISQLAILCRNRQSWTTKAENRLKLLDDGGGLGLTVKQQKWLNNVYSCNSLESCVCQNENCSIKEEALLRNSSAKINVSDNGLRRTKRQLPERNLRPALRKEYRMLTDFERQKFHKALNRLKFELIDNTSKYDLLSIYHTPVYSPGAHWGPAFLPFHRELLKQLEVSLRSYDSSVALPYWDSTLDEGLPDPRDSILWTDSFLGNGDGYVITGPFQSWNTTHTVQAQRRLVRNVGLAPFGGLLRNEDMEIVLSKQKYENLTACVDPFFELLHGTVHMWVGGYMLDIPISPNDPSFYLHHSFVDYMWEQFRMQKQDRLKRQEDYPSQDKCCNTNHYMGNFMLPFKIRNIDGLSNTYTDNFYVYETRPVCSHNRPNCNSPYLFCDKKKYQCLSKIRPGGNCTGFDDSEICYNSMCVNNLCKSSSDQQEPKNPLNEISGSTTTTTTTTTTEATTTRRRHIAWTANIIDVNVTIPIKIEANSGERVTITIPPLPLTTAAPASTPKNMCSCSCDCPSDEVFSFDKIQKIKPTKTEFQATLKNETVDLDRVPKQKDETLNETDVEFLWFTVTVLRGDLDSVTKDLVNASIYVKGLNYDGDYVTNVAMRNGYPFYPGATLIKVKNPSSLSTEHANVQITVVHNNELCTPYCYQNSAVNYVKCSGKLELGVDDTNSDAVAVYPNEKDALLKPWNGRSRKPDYLIFLCDEAAPIKSQFSDECMFLRLDNFMLVGYSDHVEEGLALDDCKSLCRDSEMKFSFKCHSLIYWTKRKSCVITKESRFTHPALFGYFPDESAIYMDFVCQLDNILER